MTLTNSNIFSESFNLIKTFLKDNIVDPKGRYKANIVHTGFPDVNSKSFSGFPFMVLKVSILDNNPSLDISVTTKEVTILIDVVSDEATDVDTISDSIYSQIKSNVPEIHSKSLSQSGMVVSLDNKGKKIYTRTIGILGVFRK